MTRITPELQKWRQDVLREMLEQGPHTTRELGKAINLAPETVSRKLDLLVAYKGWPMVRDEAGEECWWIMPRRTSARERRCLADGCGAWFPSEGPHNRICPDCSGKAPHLPDVEVHDHAVE